MEEDKQNNQKEQRYNGWLVSNSFLKRSLAVFGYAIFVNILIYIFVLIVMVISILI